MAINWFPGHMHKARKEIADIMAQVDVVIEVLDARIPFSSENPLIPSLRGDKPCLKLLNKADLADPAMTQRWIAHLEREQGVTAIPVSQSQPEGIRALLDRIQALVSDRNVSARHVQALIMGIPNVGKSTLINILAGRRIARTGNEAGVTKSQQRIKLDNRIVLTDTPGFLWPKLTPPSCGFRLAATGAIKEKVFDYPEVALFTVHYLATHYPEALKGRYGLVDLPEDDLGQLEAVGRARGAMRRGGQVDLEKVSALLITELRGGQLGTITLETPEMTERETLEAKAEEEKRKAEKEERTRLRRQRARKNRR
ncbi:ribosome biogenesis GTPase YlqF [Marinimicrobium sp. ARAG 43.8]|uniref:ribosome biogenesis GTPase YlqF n=1 Tax=Marinimicrobium sp. ARAG 43.8 TaxID=3418719 RepID=UPI003CF2FACD